MAGGHQRGKARGVRGDGMDRRLGDGQEPVQALSEISPETTWPGHAVSSSSESRRADQSRAQKTPATCDAGRSRNPGLFTGR